MRRLMTFVILMLISGCAARPAPTPRPTLTPTSAFTVVPESPRYLIDNERSILRYTAFGQGLLGFAQIPGEFKLKGRTVTLVPEGEGFRVKLEMVIDGNTATAANGLLLTTLRSILEIEVFPFAYVSADSTQIVSLTEESLSLTLIGTLELHGHKRPLDLPITLSIKDGILKGKGTIELDLNEYEVNVPTAIMSSRIKFEAEIVAVVSP
ncbi:hypothetical protein ANRL4_04377 [Anaerolineae bacterium]|nr:hypothetical protein ANRL4_04377 [Anaerolineae bacterium]